MAIDTDQLERYSDGDAHIGVIADTNKPTLVAGLCEMLDVPYDPAVLESTDRVTASTLRALAIAVRRDRLDSSAEQVEYNRLTEHIQHHAPDDG